MKKEIEIKNKKIQIIYEPKSYTDNVFMQLAFDSLNCLEIIKKIESGWEIIWAIKSTLLQIFEKFNYGCEPLGTLIITPA